MLLQPLHQEQDRGRVLFEFNDAFRVSDKGPNRVHYLVSEIWNPTNFVLEGIPGLISQHASQLMCARNYRQQFGESRGRYGTKIYPSTLR